MSIETRCRKIAPVLALLALAVMAVPAFAQVEPDDPCVQAASGGHVTCTAGDVKIAFADNPRHLDGTPFTPAAGCTEGTKFSFVADFHVTTTATERSNIGLYFQTSGSGNAVTGATGTCENNIIAPPHLNSTGEVCLGSGATATETNTGSCSGPGTYEEEDSNGEPTFTQGGTVGCGDITTSDNNQVVTIEVDGADCVAGTNGMLLLPNAVTWQQSGGIQFCTASPPNYSWDDTKSATAGATSKCSHNDTFTVPITVQSPTISVAKSCTTTISSQTTPPLTNCDAGTDNGGTVTYHVTVTNTSNTGTLTLNDICDTYYGTIALASGTTAQPCWQTNGLPVNPPGTLSGTNGCGLPQTLQSAGNTGDSYNCTFQASQGESEPSVVDVAHAYGLGQDGKTGFSGNSGSVTVTAEESPSSATVTKNWVSTTSACFTVRYSVDVANTSPSGSDENLTLTGLTDTISGSATAWDLTKINTDTGNSASPILGTTCGVAAKGTLAGSALAGGPFTALNAGGSDYICNFDAQICGSLGSVSACTTGSTGFSSMDTVNATISGDESTDTVTVTPGSKTVSECVSTSVN